MSRADKKKEWILCAAIWYEDGKKHEHQPSNIQTGIVIAGRRHHNCFTTLSDLLGIGNYNKMKIQQGFITSGDRYVSRKEAWEIAEKMQQITTIYLQDTVNSLFSEDLY